MRFTLNSLDIVLLRTIASSSSPTFNAVNHLIVNNAHWQPSMRGVYLPLRSRLLTLLRLRRRQDLTRDEILSYNAQRIALFQLEDVALLEMDKSQPDWPIKLTQQGQIAVNRHQLPSGRRRPFFKRFARLLGTAI